MQGVVCPASIKLAAAHKALFAYKKTNRRKKTMKRTYQPKKRSRAKVHGFLGRMASKNGRKVIAARRKKGRAKLAV